MVRDIVEGPEILQSVLASDWGDTVLIVKVLEQLANVTGRVDGVLQSQLVKAVSSVNGIGALRSLCRTNLQTGSSWSVPHEGSCGSGLTMPPERSC